MDDDYEIPVWKKTAHQPVSSYSKNKARTSPKKIIVNFADDFVESSDRRTVQTVKNVRKKQKKAASKLEDIFEKSYVYQDLQKIKDMPLNIEEVDLRGNVLKRYESYFDYEANKHDVVEVMSATNGGGDAIGSGSRVNSDTEHNKCVNHKKAIHHTQSTNKRNKVLQNLNSSVINRTTFEFNRSSFDLSIIEQDRSFLANSGSFRSYSLLLANRSLISHRTDGIHKLDEQEKTRASNLDKLYTSFDETRNITLDSLEKLDVQEKILKFCKPNVITKFSNVLNRKVTKMAEGAYADVYRLDKATILKVIKLNDEHLEHILPEIIVSRVLNDLRTQSGIDGFIKLKRCCLVKDKYSKYLLNAWHHYNDHVKQSENEDPANYDEDSLYILLFLNDGGQSIESVYDNHHHHNNNNNHQDNHHDNPSDNHSDNVHINNHDNKLEPIVAISIFRQVLLSLAVAEQTIEFEHRDLHLGNILIRETNECEIKCNLMNGDLKREFRVATNGIVTSIIDYSLTRFTKNGVTVFQDLNDSPELFEGKGDPQYTVYRKMRKLCDSKWATFCPSTNVVWLEYLAEKLDSLLTSGGDGARSDRRRKLRDSDERKQIAMLRKYKTQLKKYDSCLKAAFDLLNE